MAQIALIPRFTVNSSLIIKTSIVGFFCFAKQHVRQLYEAISKDGTPFSKNCSPALELDSISLLSIFFLIGRKKIPFFRLLSLNFIK